ncbi:hypothetical protein PUNSTDRAFT_48473 [Punctularia strigosozonata HHB-11173 SS5]|uniref:uncharacterized protein n=1 Tax=Punctularia strigosozonata (strain HHB-11173) TaxID=741275 RepID=UPI00044165AA|nr:uncharacterized protein PUNSTDRAFT_48473 [Punctularia strigosozonata HHB-11173 SS5]EIN13525.1 hypothetical protein PUNSTDRAFT_48473 [Punctularia strigosozonata HHB-11173 SS5]
MSTSSSAVSKPRKAAPSHPANLLTVAHRKGFALRHPDGTPFTRADIQYDLLALIFDPAAPAAFVDPHPTLDGRSAGSPVTFRDLYVNALFTSPRTSRVLKDRMKESPGFATDFAKIALLANVGRINTTACFVPESRTNLRSYHPVPALMQHDSGGNLQDAPRIKNILKAAISETEQLAPPSTLADIVALEKSGKHVTSIVNLVFVLANNSPSVAQLHFTPGTQYDFLDLFTPIPLSSASRARVFLWLCWHYLQSYRTPNVPNPFDDPGTRACPPLAPLSASEAAAENVDPEDEQRMGADMAEKRRLFREKGELPGKPARGGAEDDESVLGDGASTVDDGELDTASASISIASRSGSVAGDGAGKPSRRGGRGGGAGRGRGKRKAPVPDEPDEQPPLTGLEALSAEAARRLSAQASSPIPSPPKPKRQRNSYRGFTPENLDLRPRGEAGPSSKGRATAPTAGMSTPTSQDALPPGAVSGYASISGDEYDEERFYGAPPEVVAKREPVEPVMDAQDNAYVERERKAHGHSHHAPSRPGIRRQRSSRQSRGVPAVPYNVPVPVQYAPPPPPRTMLQHAWHIIATTDPLVDSDDESADEHVRTDYIRRLQILDRWRDKFTLYDDRAEPPNPAPGGIEPQ